MPDASEILLLKIPPEVNFTIAKTSLTCWQPFYPHARECERQGMRVVTDLEAISTTYACIIHLGTKFKEENLFVFSRVASLLSGDGIFIGVCTNDMGAKTYETQLRKLFKTVHTKVKKKCRIVQATKSPGLYPDIQQEWHKKGNLAPIEGTSLSAYAGTFSSHKIDTASTLLLRMLPEKMEGTGADLGAGYGYLSHSLLIKHPTIKAIHLYEADYNALKSATYNLTPVATKAAISFQWHDVTKGLLHNNLDWIIMNPPFHSEKNKTFPWVLPL